MNHVATLAQMHILIDRFTNDGSAHDQHLYAFFAENFGLYSRAFV